MYEHENLEYEKVKNYFKMTNRASACLQRIRRVGAHPIYVDSVCYKQNCADYMNIFIKSRKRLNMFCRLI